MHYLLTVFVLFAAAWAAGAEEQDDQFGWLEDVTGDKVLDWVKERNATSTGELTKGSEFTALNERLLNILDSKDRIPGITKRGPWYYNHNAKANDKYPRTLFMTSTRDDRVHPGHARKMVAKLSEMGHNVLLYENIEGGHGGAADNKQAAFMSALAYTFLWKELK